MPTFPPSLEATYRPVRVLGAGGMGAVWLCQDLRLDRPVAVKLMIRPDVPTLAKRMEREAEVLARVKHPHVAQVFATGSVAEGPYLVFEYVEGKSLAAEILPEAVALPLMLQVADGLEAVHRVGVVHRDLTPKNVMRTPQGKALLIDFGLVFDPDRTRLTATGAAVGTPGAMPPEIWKGQAVGPPADWFGWGATLYGVIQGRYPYDLQALATMSETMVPIPLAPALPFSPGVRRAIEACLHPDQDRRPASRAEIQALIAGDQGRDSGARPRMLVSSGGLAAPAPARGPGKRAALAGAGLAVALIGLWTFARPAPPVAGGGGPPGASAPVPDPAWVEAALLELEQARGQTVRDPEHDDERPVLDPDPLAYARVVTAQPAVGRLRAWLAGGGRPEDLDPDVRDGLGLVDRAWAERGLARPFQAFLAASPGAPGPWPPAFKARFGLAEPSPGGWLGTAAASYDLLGAELAKLDREPPAGARTMVSILSETPGGPVPFTKWVEDLSIQRADRLAVRGRLVAGHELMERMIYAGARAIRDEPARRTMAAALVAIACFDLRAFFHGPLMGGMVEGLTGPEVATPEGALLRARVLDRVLYARRGPGVPGTALAREETDLWARAVAGLPREGWGKMASETALAGWVDSLVEWDRGDELADFVDGLRLGRYPTDPWVEVDMLVDMANWIEGRPVPGGFSKDRVTWVAGRLEALGPTLPAGELADRARRRALGLRGRLGG